MGYVIWPICLISIFGTRYIVNKYLQEKTQGWKLLCTMGMLASGLTLMLLGFYLGIFVAGTVQILVNLTDYKKNPDKFQAEIDLGSKLTQFETMDIVQLFLYIVIMAVICFIAFKAMITYHQALRGYTPKNILLKSENNSKRAVTKEADTADNKAKKEATIFCPKCGTRLAENTVECSSCGRKIKKK